MSVNRVEQATNMSKADKKIRSAVRRTHAENYLLTLLIAFGSRLGRRGHRALISVILILWVFIVIGFITILTVRIPSLESQVVQWRGALITIQVIVGALMIVAAVTWLKEEE